MSFGLQGAQQYREFLPAQSNQKILQFGVWIMQNEPPAQVFCLLTILNHLQLSPM